MSEKIRVRKVDTTPEQDGFDTTYSSLWIDPENCTCGVEQKYSNNATPMEEYLDYILTYEIDNEDGSRVDEDDLAEYLQSEPAQGLLNRICEGWYTDSDGRNERGYLDKEATSAVKKLLAKISGLSSTEYANTRANEWVIREDADVNALTTDDELVELSDEIEEDAESQDVVIDDSVYDLLERWRDEAVEEWLGKARDAIECVWDEDVAITHHPYDKTVLEVVFEFSDGTRGIVHVSDGETKVIVAPERQEQVN